MSLQDVNLNPNRHPRKQLSEYANVLELRSRSKQTQRLSEPKPKINLIKINKHKLPLDFFPKKDLNLRRHSHLKNYFKEELSQPLLPYKKTSNSERIHYTPEKTSFFGFLEEKEPALQITGPHKLFSRKFETREEGKRQTVPLEPPRKLNTAAKSNKNQLLELFPSAYSNQLNEFLAHSSKTQFLRNNLRREPLAKLKEPIQLPQDPEKTSRTNDQTQANSNCYLNSPNTHRDRTNSHNISISDNTSQEMTMTFYNGKTNCFPPINRTAN